MQMPSRHAVGVLQELYTCEDVCADFVELSATVAGGVVTKEMAIAHEAVAKIAKLVSLSEHIESDASFARQTRRKFCARR